jgi:hypothetical protein
MFKGYRSSTSDNLRTAGDKSGIHQVGCIFAIALFFLGLIAAKLNKKVNNVTSVTAVGISVDDVPTPEPYSVSASSRSKSHYSKIQLLLSFLIGVGAGVVANTACSHFIFRYQVGKELRSLGYIAHAENGDIWVCRADGGSRRRVVVGANPRAMAWSPDGTQLAFLRQYHTKEANSIALYVIDFTNGLLSKYTKDIPGVAEGNRLVWADRASSIAFDYHPTLGHDGAPSMHARASYNDCTVYTEFFPGSERKTWFFPACYSPCLTANGLLSAVRKSFDKVDGAVVTHIINCPTDYFIDNTFPPPPSLCSTAHPPLSESGNMIDKLSLSPRCEQWAFKVRWNAGGQLWVLDIYNDSKPRCLTQLDNILDLCWQPSGEGILVLHRYQSTSSEAATSSEGLLLVSPIDGTYRQIVTRAMGTELTFNDQCWSYDSRWLLLTASLGWWGDEWKPIATVLMDLNTGRKFQMGDRAFNLPRLQPRPSEIACRVRWSFKPDGKTIPDYRLHPKEILSKWRDWFHNGSFSDYTDRAIANQLDNSQ